MTERDRSAAIYDTCKRDVVQAMQMAKFKHGEVTSDPVRGAATLCEEAGEVSCEALESTRAHVSKDEKRNKLDNMVHELNQVIGYAMMLRASMEDEVRKLREELG